MELREYRDKELRVKQNKIKHMAQQYHQTKKQKITIFIVLLALAIVIAQRISAGTLSASQGEFAQCDENVSAAMDDASWNVSDLPWSPFIAFLTR